MEGDILTSSGGGGTVSYQGVEGGQSNIKWVEGPALDQGGGGDSLTSNTRPIVQIVLSSLAKLVSNVNNAYSMLNHFTASQKCNAHK